MLHSLSIFLAYLSLFCVQFYVFSNSQHFLFFSLLFLPLTAILQLLLSPVFSLFRPSLTASASFQPFFAFSQLIFIFFPIFASSVVLHPLFAIFQLSLHFFTSTYVTLPGSFFMFHAPQNVSRETSFFTIFGLQRSVRSDLLFLFPKITLVFGLSDF